MGGLASSRNATFSAPPDPPVPLAAVDFAGIPNPSVVVTWDQPLAPGLLAPSNWSARLAGVAYSGVACSAAGVETTTFLLAGHPDPGKDEVSYSPPPFDVVSAKGIAAAAFAGFTVA